MSITCPYITKGLRLEFSTSVYKELLYRTRPCCHMHGDKFDNDLKQWNVCNTWQDLETHNKFAEYITKFKRIIIIYCPEPVAGFDNIDNEKYIQQLFKKIENTHQCYFNSNFSDSKIFSALKK